MGLGFTFGSYHASESSVSSLEPEPFSEFRFLPLQIEQQELCPVTIFILAPGAFLVLAFLVAGMNKIIRNGSKKGKKDCRAAGCCIRRLCIMRRMYGKSAELPDRKRNRRERDEEMKELLDYCSWFSDRKQRSTQPVPWYLSVPWCIQENRDSNRYGRRSCFRYYNLIFHYRTDLQIHSGQSVSREKGI